METLPLMAEMSLEPMIDFNFYGRKKKMNRLTSNQDLTYNRSTSVPGDRSSVAPSVRTERGSHLPRMASSPEERSSIDPF